MPYSITTRDGITINNIPDEMPADAPELKARVAQIRGQAPAPTAAPSPVGDASHATPAYRLAKGGRDPIDAGAQLLSRIPGADFVNKAADSVGGFLNRNVFNTPTFNRVIGVPENTKGDFAGEVLGIRGRTPEQMDKGLAQEEAQYQADRTAAAGKSIKSLVTGEQPDPGFDWLRMAGNMASPATLAVAPLSGTSAASTTIGRLALTGAKAGAVGGALTPVVDGGNDFWTKKATQVGLGAAGGAVAAPVIGKTFEAAGRGVERARQAVQRNNVTPDQILVASANAARAGGYDWQQMPDSLRQVVQTQVEQSLRSGQRLDPAAIMRRAEAESIGLTGDAALTTGQATRQPMQFTQERNLRGVEISTPTGRGNPLMDRFANQNRVLTQRFDDLGAGQATEPALAGQTIIDSLRRFDRPIKAGVDGAYENARSMAEGRMADLNRGAFTNAANEAIDRGMWGRFVPPEVRGLLNDITEGKVPFNVESEVQIDGILSAAQRKAQRSGDDATHSALGVIRDALRNTPFAEAQAAPGQAARAAQSAAGDVVDNGVTDAAFREIRPGALPGQPRLPSPPSQAVATARDFEVPGQSFPVGQALPQQAAQQDAGQAAREAFQQARQAARSRFSIHEQNPALQAALDDVAPDNFVRKYVLNANGRDLQALRQSLENDPEALGQARAQVANHLRRAAFGENPTGDKTFAVERYMNTLRQLGGQRLSAFFTPEEIQTLSTMGRAASTLYTQPAGSAVNNSNTASGLMTMLSRLSETPLLRRLPGGRAVANQIGEMQTEAQINRALSGQQPAQPGAQLSPEAMRALNRLLPFVSVPAGMELAGSGQ